MKKWLGLIFLAFSAFTIGVYVWKVLNTGHSQLFQSKRGNETVFEKDILLSVADMAIKKQDLQFEYDILTHELSDDESMTSIPAIPKDVGQLLKPLRTHIMDSLVERKILYAMVLKDSSFDSKDIKRFKECTTEWKSTLENDVYLFKDPENKQRLYERLCEQSLLNQYLEEKVYKSINVGEEEIQSYYEQHHVAFMVPKAVVIRQIVLADESQAKNIKAKASQRNFASLAKEYSITPEAAIGGLLEPIYSSGAMPLFFNVAFTLRIGEISEILKSTYGFHVILLEKKIPAQTLSLNEVRGRIKKTLSDKAKEIAYQRWMDLALNTIEVNHERQRW